MSYYILNSAGFVTGTYDGPGQPANSTSIAPPDGAAVPLQFLNGAWVLAQPTDRFVSNFAFFDRFTSEERAKIRQFATQDADTADFLMLANAAKKIDLDLDKVKQGINYFILVGILTADRGNTILTAQVTADEMP